MKMCFSDSKLTEDKSGSLKKSKKKQKKEDAWRPEGRRDPFAMVCCVLCVSGHMLRCTECATLL